MLMPQLSTLVPDLKLSRMIFGTWRICDKPLSSTALESLVHTCLEAGVTSFDLADIYGNFQVEKFFGAALAPGLREQVQLITKCGICFPSDQRPSYRNKFYDCSAQHIRRSVEQSLQNLKTAWIDVLLLHRPDPLMNYHEVSRVFQDLKAEGKVRAFGVSNFSAAQFEALQSQLPLPLVTNQIELHPLKSTALWDGTLDHAQSTGYLPMGWSPLAGGQIFKADDAASLRLRTCLEKLSSRYECAVDQLLLAWLLLIPSQVLPVLGTTDQQRLERQLKSVHWTLERQDWYAILEAAQGCEVP